MSQWNNSSEPSSAQKSPPMFHTSPPPQTQPEHPTTLTGDGLAYQDYSPSQVKDRGGDRGMNGSLIKFLLEEIGLCPTFKTQAKPLKGK
jgi:hypothetical protein